MDVRVRRVKEGEEKERRVEGKKERVVFFFAGLLGFLQDWKVQRRQEKKLCWRVQRTIERLRPKKSGKGGVVGAVGVYTMYYSPSLFWMFGYSLRYISMQVAVYVVYRVNTVGMYLV